MKSMKKGALFVLVFLLTSCSLIPSPFSDQIATFPPNTDMLPTVSLPEIPATQAVPLSLESFKNVHVFAPELKKDVQLMNGTWSETQPDGSIQNVVLDEHFAIGDLNGDGIVDAAIILAESMGGTGTFYSIVTFFDINGVITQVSSQYVDDRPIINSLEINQGDLALDVKVHGINDPMIDPTLQLVKTYRFFSGHQLLWRQEQKLDDGKVREINIESPVDGQEISGDTLILGNMPIAPFENNLRVQILDVSLVAVYTNGMMVSAADVGMPAKINSSIPTSSIKPGEDALIQLAELSMADGSVLALDTVLVKVK